MSFDHPAGAERREGFKVSLGIVPEQISISRHIRHCKGIDWIVARDREPYFAVGHDGVYAFANNSKTNFAENTHCVSVTDAGQFRPLKE